MSVTIEQAFKQVLEAAIHQVKHKTYEREPDNDAVEAFIEDLFAVLFPSNSQTIQAVTVPTVAATVTVAAPAPAPEKPKRGRKPKAQTEAPAPAETAPAPEPKKRGRKPKAVTPPPAPETTEATPTKTKNLEKPFTATNKKYINKWADEVGAAAPDMKELFNHLNAMTPEEFNGSTLEQHVKNFLQPKEEVAQPGDDLLEVPFNDKTYYVNEKTNRVFEQQGEDNYVAVGYVGMAAFADMKL